MLTIVYTSAPQLSIPPFYFVNKNPPAKPGVFLMRAKPYVTSHASCGVGTV